ncbi:hypothetical protein ACQP1P_38120 [Dactylosporangium sp. CA-052675]|uniref:hypothetical protein n=1 Tax=Dactylosporangium sp. CA-052675 TaxID=3239927 RepID=UPI003D8CA014
MDYVRHHVEGGTFEEQLDMLRRRATANYIIEQRGVILADVTHESLPDVVNQLFRDCVKDEGPTQPSLDDLANDVLRRLAFPKDHKLEPQVTYSIPIRGVSRDLRFDYRYVNGKITLIEKISLTDRPANVETRVNDLLFRFDHVSQAKKINHFVALFDVGNAGSTAPVEHHLKAIEEFSPTVNVRDEDAAETVGGYLGVVVK